MEEPKVISIGDSIVIKDFAEKLGRSIPEVIAHLMQNGIMLSLNERIDFETASIIAGDFDVEVKKADTAEAEQKNVAVDVEKLEELLKEDQTNGAVARAPVVVVMGHVDHGKTTLLDAIRKTNVAGGEAGGITQSIGAYQVLENNRPITFIDTPGHEAFSAMRSRGANVADIAILVIAADDGLKPQTKEALEIIQRAGLPFVVALNKIDKEGADIQRVKTSLTEIGLTPEDWGGKTVIAEVSAKKGTGIHELLDLVLLVADLHADEITANPAREAVGTIIEAHIDKGAGPVATVLIQSGTLHMGDLVTVGAVYGKVKALKDYTGETVREAVPSMPVRILGLKEAPEVGDILHVTSDRQMIKKAIREHAMAASRRRTREAAPPSTKTDEDKKSLVKKLNIVLKTDTVSSQEAIAEAIAEMSYEGVHVSILSKGLGNVTDKDVDQANTGRAMLLAFNVRATPDAKEIARERAVKIKEFSIIYELLDEIKAHLEALLSPEIIEVDLGALRVLQLFKQRGTEQIVGGKVVKGKVARNAEIRIERKGEALGQGTVLQLQAEKKDVPEVREGLECGVRVKAAVPILVGDELTFFTKEQRARKLEKQGNATS
ncbi:MAG: translation initiation factor IF-2 [Candidatus Kerfeldbacteria bacterium]|nr:translation initiation factor IF-2 [Candidatus Kerfeldbacteria bacterium]